MSLMLVSSIICCLEGPRSRSIRMCPARIISVLRSFVKTKEFMLTKMSVCSRDKKGCALVDYWTIIQKLIKSFSSIQFDHVSYVHNKDVDALVVLATKVDILDETVDVKVRKRTLRATVAYLVLLIYGMSRIGEVPLSETWINPLQPWLKRIWKIFVNDELYDWALVHCWLEAYPWLKQKKN